MAISARLVHRQHRTRCVDCEPRDQWAYASVAACIPTAITSACPIRACRRISAAASPSVTAALILGRPGRPWPSVNSFFSTRSESASRSAAARSSEAAHRMKQPHFAVVRASKRRGPGDDSPRRRGEGHGAQNAINTDVTGGHWRDGERALHAYCQRNRHATIAARLQRETGEQSRLAIELRRDRPYKLKAGRFQTETLPGTATDQPGGPIGGSIDCSGRMDCPSLSLDVAGRAEINNDLAEK